MRSSHRRRGNTMSARTLRSATPPCKPSKWQPWSQPRGPCPLSCRLESVMLQPNARYPLLCSHHKSLDLVSAKSRPPRQRMMKLSSSRNRPKAACRLLKLCYSNLRSDLTTTDNSRWRGMSTVFNAKRGTSHLPRLYSNHIPNKVQPR